MQAVVLTKDFKLEFQSVPVPTPGTGQVRIAVSAAALNRRDYWITQKLYPKIKVPVILGSDGAGKVVELGEGVEKKWLNEQVVINPTHGWSSVQSANGAPAMHDLQLLGMPIDGTLAEYVVVDVSRVHKKPSHLSDVEAASVPLAGVTAYRALFQQGQAKCGSTVFVTGIGSGVSSFVAQFAAAAGCKVVVSSSSQEKLDQAIERHTLAGGVLYSKPAKEWTREALQLIDSSSYGGFDLVVDGAAGRDFNELLKLLKPGGTIVSYGGTAGKPIDLDIFRIFLLQLKILGTSMGSDQDFSDMIQFVSDHRIIPVISDTHLWQAATKAIAEMENSKSRGKVIILPPHSKL